MAQNLFDPKSSSPFTLSRSKIDLYFNCPRCFYLDRRLGISRPPGFPFSLNYAVDALLKKEFDFHRAKGDAHPLMKKYGIDAVPFKTNKINDWRNNFQGIRYHYKPANFIIFGAIDDVWQNSKGELIVVDYKATSTTRDITINDGQPYHEGYKRQVEVYQWLLRRNGYKVSPTAYFVYCNGKKDEKAFDGKLEFDVQLIKHEGNDSWIEPKLMEIRKCLESDVIPPASPTCPYCQYRRNALIKEKEFLSTTSHFKQTDSHSEGEKDILKTKNKINSKPIMGDNGQFKFNL